MNELFLDPETGAPTSAACTWMALSSIQWQWGNGRDISADRVYIARIGKAKDDGDWLIVDRDETIGMIARQTNLYWIWGDL